MSRWLCMSLVTDLCFKWRSPNANLMLLTSACKSPDIFLLHKPKKKKNCMIKQKMKENSKRIYASNRNNIRNIYNPNLPSSGSASKTAAYNPSFKHHRSLMVDTILLKLFLVFPQDVGLSSSIRSEKSFAEQLSVAPVSMSRLRKASCKQEFPSDKQFKATSSASIIFK